MRKSLILNDRFTALCLTLCLSSTTVFAQLKDTLTLNAYNNETEIKASKIVVLKPGFYIPAGKTVRVFIQGVSMVPTAPFAGVPSINQNYVSIKTFKIAGIKNDQDINAPHMVSEVNQSIQYVDGLGRPIQAVVTQGSPSFQDLVTPITYDAFGREALKYQSYMAVAGTNGSYRTAALTEQGAYYQGQNPDLTGITNTANPYAVTVFEPSPLNRVIEQGAQGASWQPILGSSSGHTIKTDYLANGTNEVRLWRVAASGANGTDFYQPGTLYKKVTKDENWAGEKTGTTEEFKNFDGQVVLKRTWETEIKSLSTYYIYDDLNNLRYVLPPAVNENGQNISSFSESDTVFDQYIYGYHYDGRKRVIEKKIPGKGWEYLIYNTLDQVVLTQDSNQRARTPKEWLFTKYDGLGRTIMTGIYQDNNSKTIIQNAINAQTGVLWESRDNANTSQTGTGYTSQTVPASSISVYHTITYYDDYDFFGNTLGQPDGAAQVLSARTRGLETGSRVNVLGGNKMLLSVNYYDQEGRVLQTKGQNNVDGQDITDNGWNFAGELVVSTRTHTKAGSTTPTTIVTKNRYDHMGRKFATVKSINGQPEVVTSRMYYNDLGQLLKKGLHSTDSTAFMQNTQYVYNERGWLKKGLSNEFSEILGYEEGSQWNGNISSQQWGAGKSVPLVNTFTYSYDHLSRLTNASSTGVVMSESVTYDLMGNINTLKRDAGAANQYHYQGNRLASVDGLSGSYAYDSNGNATTDGRTGVILTYNHLNLPVSAVKADASLNIAYTFDATGAKLKKVSSTNGITDYVGGIQYQNGTIDFIQTEDGIARNNSGVYSYEYNLVDHLGNVRYSFHKNPVSGTLERLQSDDYYAFGLRKSSGSPISLNNKYLYNGKELQDELNQYDYGARFYDPVVGRWNVVDPLAEGRAGITPYHFVSNNPLIRVDPDGRWDWVKNGNDYRWDDRVVNQETAEKYQGSGAQYIGEAATITAMRSDTGEAVGSSIDLNSDGTITSDGVTLQQNSSETFTNATGSTFKARQTEGSFLGASYGFALAGGYSVAAGIVTDATGKTSPYFTFSGNIGLGEGGQIESGVVKPVGPNQFVLGDFEGKGGAYNFGVSSPRGNYGLTIGGSLDPSIGGSKAMRPEAFGSNARGYTTNQLGFAHGGGGVGFSAMYSFSNTWLYRK